MFSSQVKALVCRKDLVDALKKEYDKSLKLVEDEDAAWDRACEKVYINI